MNTKTDKHFVSELSTSVGYIRIVANENAVTEIRFFDDSIYANEAQIAENKVSKEAKKQLLEYLDNKRINFDLPLAPKGTEFQQKVWRALCDIAHGETVSYLDIAKALNKPKACRAVGAANGKNPISIVIPCHRVIGSSGKLTGYAGGLSRKSFLLALEAK